MRDQKLSSKLKSFNENGFIILKVFTNKIIDKYKKKILKNLKKSAKQKSIKSIDSLTKLEDYFSFISKDQHKKLMDRDTRTIKIDASDADLIFNTKNFKGLLNYFSDKDYEILRNRDKWSWKGKDSKNQAGFRIVKPSSELLEKKTTNIAGYHSDHYNLKNFRFTLWIPLAGFNKKYSLKMIPGSHIYKHKNNVTAKNPNGAATLLKHKYLNIFKKPYRPNLKPGEAILFHPYLIHGNAINLGNKTRVSLELRIGNN